MCEVESADLTVLHLKFLFSGEPLLSGIIIPQAGAGVWGDLKPTPRPRFQRLQDINVLHLSV